MGYQCADQYPLMANHGLRTQHIRLLNAIADLFMCFSIIFSWLIVIFFHSVSAIIFANKTRVKCVSEQLQFADRDLTHMMCIDQQIPCISIGYHVRTKTGAVKMEENGRGIADQWRHLRPLSSGNCCDVATSCVFFWSTCCRNNLLEICTYMLSKSLFHLVASDLHGNGRKRERRECLSGLKLRPQLRTLSSIEDARQIGTRVLCNNG